jgi:hypothetical protein
MRSVRRDRPYFNSYARAGPRPAAPQAASARRGAISPVTKEALKYSLMLEHFTQTNGEFPRRPMLSWN